MRFICWVSCPDPHRYPNLKMLQTGHSSCSGFDSTGLTPPSSSTMAAEELLNPSRSVSFLVCEMRTGIPTLQAFPGDLLRLYMHVNQYTAWSTACLDEFRECKFTFTVNDTIFLHKPATLTCSPEAENRAAPPDFLSLSHCPHLINRQTPGDTTRTRPHLSIPAVTILTHAFIIFTWIIVAAVR